MRWLVMVVLLVGRPAAAGPYMTGLGAGGNLLGPDFLSGLSGPIYAGGGHDLDGPVLRLGVGMVVLEDAKWFSRPEAMYSVDVHVHFGSDTATVQLEHQRALGRFLVGGAAGVALRERASPTPLRVGADPSEPTTEAGLAISPEITLPLRLGFVRGFAPTALLSLRTNLILYGGTEVQRQLVATLAFTSM